MAKFREVCVCAERGCVFLNCCILNTRHLLVINYKRNSSENKNDSVYIYHFLKTHFLHTFSLLLSFVFLACKENTSQKGISVSYHLSVPCARCLHCVEMLLYMCQVMLCSCVSRVQPPGCGYQADDFCHLGIFV